MILVIRIGGLVKMNYQIEEALFRLRLRRKYAAVLLHNTKENLILIKGLRDYIAYGEISDEMLKKLIVVRGQAKGKKIDADKVIEGLNKKGLEELGLKPFFRLHPPRGGIKSRLHFPKGVLGDHGKDINKLLGRML